MYLIHGKGVRVEINRESRIEAISRQLSELSDRELEMVSDYIYGLRVAGQFLTRT